MENKNFNNKGIEYVDLGLKSGTLWATKNVGANKPTDFGLYFQWGDTKGYTAEQVGKDKQFSWNDYKWDGGDTLKKYKSKGAALKWEDDAANANMGGDWHIPSPSQIRELLSNTTNEWTTLDNVSGMKFTSKKDASKFIFIPAAGYAWNGSVKDGIDEGFVWSGILSESDAYYNQSLGFYSEGANLYSDYRGCGFSVRGVIG